MDPAYFSDKYADDCDAAVDMGQISNNKYIEVPLGIINMKGPINFSNAAPKPVVREESAQSEKKQKSRKDDKCMLPYHSPILILTLYRFKR